MGKRNKNNDGKVEGPFGATLMLRYLNTLVTLQYTGPSYTKEQRKKKKAQIKRWGQKKGGRRPRGGKNTRYGCRKRFADRRPRVGGRFVKMSPGEKLILAETEAETKRVEAEAETRRVEAEAETRRVEEAKTRRVEAEAETKRVEEAETRRVEAEAEAKRVEEAKRIAPPKDLCFYFGPPSGQEVSSVPQFNFPTMLSFVEHDPLMTPLKYGDVDIVHPFFV